MMAGRALEHSLPGVDGSGSEELARAAKRLQIGQRESEAIARVGTATSGALELVRPQGAIAADDPAQVRAAVISIVDRLRRERARAHEPVAGRQMRAI